MIFIIVTVFYFVNYVCTSGTRFIKEPYILWAHAGKAHLFIFKRKFRRVFIISITVSNYVFVHFHWFSQHRYHQSEFIHQFGFHFFIPPARLCSRTRVTPIAMSIYQHFF